MLTRIREMARRRIKDQTNAVPSPTSSQSAWDYLAQLLRADPDDEPRPSDEPGDTPGQGLPEEPASQPATGDMKVFDMVTAVSK